jgi:hypothetical protein
VRARAAGVTGCWRTARRGARPRRAARAQLCAARRRGRRNHGVCIRNAAMYGSKRALALALILNPKLIVSKEDAKEFKFLKMCLVFKYGW